MDYVSIVSKDTGSVLLVPAASVQTETPQVKRRKPRPATPKKKDPLVELWDQLFRR